MVGAGSSHPRCKSDPRHAFRTQLGWRWIGRKITNGCIDGRIVLVDQSAEIPESVGQCVPSEVSVDKVAFNATINDRGDGIGKSGIQPRSNPRFLINRLLAGLLITGNFASDPVNSHQFSGAICRDRHIIQSNVVRIRSE